MNETTPEMVETMIPSALNGTSAVKEETVKKTKRVRAKKASAKKTKAATKTDKKHLAKAATAAKKLQKAEMKAAAKAGKPVKAKKTKPSSGQSGEPIELTREDMNKAELKVLDFVYSKAGERKSFPLLDMQAKIFGKHKNGTSPTRNALRRLVRAGWVEKVGRGSYRLTERGRKRGARSKG